MSFFYALYQFWHGIRRGLGDPEFEVLLFLTVSVLLLGTVTYHYTEHWHWLDSLYFSVTTLTTVGFGDFTPHTTGGKIFTIVYIFIGIGILFSFINILAQHTVEETTRQQNRKEGPWMMRRIFPRSSEKPVPDPSAATATTEPSTSSDASHTEQ